MKTKEEMLREAVEELVYAEPAGGTVVGRAWNIFVGNYQVNGSVYSSIPPGLIKMKQNICSCFTAVMEDYLRQCPVPSPAMTDEELREVQGWIDKAKLPRGESAMLLRIGNPDGYYGVYSDDHWGEVKMAKTLIQMKAHIDHLHRLYSDEEYLNQTLRSEYERGLKDGRKECEKELQELREQVEIDRYDRYDYDSFGREE